MRYPPLHYGKKGVIEPVRCLAFGASGLLNYIPSSPFRFLHTDKNPFFLFYLYVNKTVNQILKRSSLKISVDSCFLQKAFFL
jgi:hypothetical protein